MKKLVRFWNSFAGYMRRTWLVKIIVVAMIALGSVAVALTGTGDITALVFLLVFCVPAFVMDWKEEEL